MDDIKKVLEKEVLDKSQFVEECKETEDLRNASYWEAFVHGIKFSLDVIDDHLTSQDRLRIGVTMRKDSGDTPGDISNAAWRLHVQRRTAEVKMMDEEIRKRKLGKSHTAKLAEGEE